MNDDFEELEAIDGMHPSMDVLRAITRLRAHGFGHECDTLLGHGEAAWQQLRVLLDVLRRLDPAWCVLNDQTQISDEELDQAIGELEDLVEGAT